MNQSTRIIKTGILGAGQPNIATNHQLPATLKSKLAEAVALCDMNPGVFEYAQKYRLKAYTDYSAMLADPEIEMVQIATPDWCHCRHAEMALQAGKHVLLQKPPCLNRDELLKLAAAAKQSAGSLKVLLNCRETRLCRSIKKCIDNGVIGQLREIIINYRGRRFPVDDPQSRYLKAECGGVWLHNSMHWLDEAFLYSGSLPDMAQLFAAKNDCGEPRFLGEGPNYWSAIFPMKNNVTFNFEYNTMLLRDGLPGGMQRALIGTEGEIRQIYGNAGLMLYRRSKEPEPLSIVDAELSPEEDVIESFRLAIDAYATQIVTGVEQSPRINDSLALMNALLNGIESWETEQCLGLEDFNAIL